MSPIESCKQLVKGARKIAALTGAGVSAESGIPTFRSASGSNGGYWQQHRFEDLATPEAFHRDPKFVWTWYEERRRAIATAQPNAGHYALTKVHTLITQNVDGLHDLAGSRNIVKLHGDIWLRRCLSCGLEVIDRKELDDLPPRCGCGGLQRPGVVWFGESLPPGAYESAAAAVHEADVFLVAGTSAQVYPAAGLIPLALRAGATVIEINPAETDFSDEVTYSLRGPSAELLPALFEI